MEKFYIYQLNKTFFEVASYAKLLDWCLEKIKARGTIFGSSQQAKDLFFSSICHSWNEVYVKPEINSWFSIWNRGSFEKAYLIKDEYDRIINSMDLKKDSANHIHTTKRWIDSPYGGYWEWKVAPPWHNRKPDPNYPEFRRGPVPGTGKYKRWKSNRRNPGMLLGEAKAWEAHSNLKKVRLHRRRNFNLLLGIWWDDPAFRASSKDKHSWKKNKKKKQWM